MSLIAAHTPEDQANMRERIQAVAARAGLKAIKVGMRCNSSYTPKNCMAIAKKHNPKLKARDYDGGIAALTTYLGG